MDLKIKRLKPGAHIPGRATPGAAGMDLRACCSASGFTLQPLERALIPTGIAIELPSEKMVGLVFARSGLALKQGLAMANGVGVIDSDYRGEVSVPVVNLSNVPIHVANGERIAQLVIVPVELPQMIEIDNLTDTSRGAGGFGSTGVK
ncbi:MAG: dUTP diphosphatase [Oscillospiraceae bacterium]